jgi:hypothetical protein
MKKHNAPLHGIKPRHSRDVNKVADILSHYTRENYPEIATFVIKSSNQIL